MQVSMCIGWASFWVRYDVSKCWLWTLGSCVQGCHSSEGESNLNLKVPEGLWDELQRLRAGVWKDQQKAWFKSWIVTPLLCIHFRQESVLVTLGSGSQIRYTYLNTAGCGGDGEEKGHQSWGGGTEKGEVWHHSVWRMRTRGCRAGDVALRSLRPRLPYFLLVPDPSHCATGGLVLPQMLAVFTCGGYVLPSGI